jgi:hypothetical protein
VISRYTPGFKPRLPDAEIIELYREHRDSVTVGALANCSGTTVLHILKRTGHGDLITRHTTRKPKTPRRLPLSDAEIVERYQAGASLTDLVDQTGGGHPRIRSIIQAAGVPIRTATHQRRLSEHK